MIKNRHFMLGLGCGLIAGALLLQLMILGQGGGKIYTAEQVKQAAEQLGLKVVAADEELLTEEQWQEKAGTGQEDGGEGVEPDVPASPKNPDAPQAPAAPAKPSSAENKPPASADAEKPQTPAKPAKPAAVSVEYKIAYGSTLAGVAEGLYKAGVITEKEAFLKAAKAKKINNKIRTGTYTFTEGEDYDSIIAKISPKASGK
ncbi:MAG: endolytic transglycosylase MltG [Paenibacillus macerans]|uniref:YceG-like family protein n=1 Tax=Paenibacillus macerans TaxID=44252 RepID=A0A090ZY65_PAEMA|nr:endolytic transglycosylase MltG [Paenibacillus macerans]KFN09041.1 yceG-like family protein [Paenibacillus macerans]MBS5909849.1 endolytic transglycosylase MltG [Paenibacillus macerans]MCY7562543.1 endolytic transglycosylase MltG [Paenibacillus macerans]MDU7473206.1 endolytic transglycosylase MltG [Paenibacillus macerans]MEC0136016.1 endolytic transglycosylase MltG [Paenibacillus macerans]